MSALVFNPNPLKYPDYIDPDAAAIGAQLASTVKSLVNLRRAQYPGTLIDLPIAVSRFNAYNQGFSNGTDTDITYQYWVSPTTNVTAPVLCFGNWSLGGAAGPGSAIEAYGLNNITVSASIFPSFEKLTFGGQASVVIAPGATVKTDPSPRLLVAGTQYAIRVRVQVTAGQKWPLGTYTLSTLGEGSTTGDLTTGGSLPTLSTAPGYGPFAVLGVPAADRPFRNVGVVGDSIASGYGLNETPDQGWIVRGLTAAKIPWIRAAIAGGSIGGFTSASKSLGLLMVSGVDDIIVNFGANDLGAAASFDTFVGVYQKIWKALASGGARVYQTTILPCGAHNTASRAMRIQFNDYIRTSPAPLSGYIEVADLAETYRGSNIWKTGYSDDLVHPNAFGAVQLQVAVPVPLFATITP